MLLKNIKLSNIRSYKSHSMDFPEGSLLLSGDIGAGKSSILLAAEFALFGIMKGDLNGENLLRHGANEGSVELKFDVDGHDVVIKRNLKRGKDSVKQESGYIVVDGIKLDGTHVELKTRILDLLGYPKELVSKSKSLVYRYTVYTPQEQMKHIIFSDSEERLNILRGVFGIDRYKRVAENSQIFIKALREKSKELEGRVYGIEEKNRQLGQQKAELGNAGEKMDELRPKLISAKNLADEKVSIMAEKEKDVGRLRELKKELELSGMRLDEKMNLREKNRKEEELLERQILETGEKISKLDVRTPRPLKEIDDSIIKKESRIREVLQQRSEFSERIKHLEAKVKADEKMIEEMSEQSSRLEQKEKELAETAKKIAAKDSIKNQAENMKRDIDGLNRMISELNATKKNSEAMIKSILKLDNCPTCLRPVDKGHKCDIVSKEEDRIKKSTESMGSLEMELAGKKELLKNAEKSTEEIVENEKRAEKLNAEISMIKKAVSNLAEKKKELAKAEQDIVSSNSRLIPLQKENIQELTKELEDEKLLLKKIQEKAHLEEMLAEKTARKNELKATQEDIKKDIGEINSSKLSVNEKIRAMGDAEAVYVNLKRDAENAREIMKRMEIEEKGIATEMQGIARAVEGLEKEISQKLIAKQKLEKIGQMRGWLENNFLNIVNMIEKNVMQKIHTQFSTLFRQWFKALVEDEALNVNLDDGFTPLVEQDGYEATIEGLSGGEKTAVALAYRLSLNKVVNDIISTIKTKDIIILDEPTDGFSSEQLDRVREVIEELGMKQVIIVSHEPKMESFVDNIIRVEKSGHVSSSV